MKKLSTMAKIIAFAMITCVLFSLVACGGGKLKLESFVVDNSSIKTTYEVGETVDFSGIKAYAKYSDESLNKTYTFAELTLTYDADITATAGRKELVVSFMDPNLNVEQKATVIIVVTDPEAGANSGTVKGFQKSDSLVAFDANNKNGTLEYGAAGFSGEFVKGGFLYVIGDDNAFKLLPIANIQGNDGIIATAAAFYADIEIYVLEGEEYVALTKQAGNGNAAAYYLGETLIADVDTYANTYDFSEAAVGKQVKISVIPSAEYYEVPSAIHAVVLEAEIVDAYNVTEAWQLSVIDNYTGRTDWDTIKSEKGIAGLNVAGIVLHNDIKITAADVPASFFYTTEKDVVYTNAVSGATTIVPKGTKYLVDGTNVFERNGADDFVIEGNFFNIDASAFPLVPSPGVFGKDSGKDYEGDFSNATLFRFETAYEAAEAPADVAEVVFENVSLIGNAKRDNLVDSEQALASAGGLIGLKASWYTKITVNNTIGNSFFIAYFPDYGGAIYANDVKCYDSYQNAAMLWADSTLIFTDCFINGSGGPVVIAQSVVDENKHPIFQAVNTKMETHVTGEEVWFVAVNAGAVITPIKALGSSLHQAGLGNFTDKVGADGKLNAIAVLMKDGSDAGAVIMNPYTQGTLDVNGNVLERWQTKELWYNILTHSSFAGAAPFLSVVDAEGNTHVLWTNGEALFDLAGNVFNPAGSMEHYATYQAFLNADTVILSQGGISIVLEFYHYN